jgi:phosphoenolpyruvate carboxykinase (ATP)
VTYVADHRFGLEVPTSCPDVPDVLLSPRGTWSDPAAYDEKADFLKEQFDASLLKIRSQA